MRTDRRQFIAHALVGAGYLAISACAPAVAPRVQASKGSGRFHFPQGVASGDPRPTSVVLWTRVEAQGGSDDAVNLTAQVSQQPDFSKVIVETSIEADAARDHTVRLLVEELVPDTTYYYRFIAGGDLSAPLGRTRTAPAPDSTRPIHFAFASCQNYEMGFFGGYRRLINDDLAAPPNEQLDFVLHVGDYIYEFVGADGGKPLLDREGRPRRLPSLPDGGADYHGLTAAGTVDDYRALYRAYHSDPDLRAARARWPFVVTWDDHEYSNDSWQSYSTSNEGDAPAQRRKLAANQAWFEYIPAHLSGAPGVPGVGQAARDFEAIEVRDAAPSSVADAPRDPNNLAAIGSMTIYRSLRFGRNVELVVTDSRSYRSDHAVPDDIASELGAGLMLLPHELVRDLDQGQDANGGNPPAFYRAGATQVPNTRRSAAPGTVLGVDQKAWWKATMARSDATWKIWASSIPSLALRIDLGSVDERGEDLLLSSDAWDGYPTERAELMHFLRDREVRNVLSLAGDYHMHFAGQLMADYDSETLTPVGSEFVVGGLSASSLFSIFAHSLAPEIRDIVVADRTQPDGSQRQLELFNLTLLDGVAASQVIAAGGELDTARAARNPRHARHLHYMDSDAYGYGLVSASTDHAEVTLVRIERPVHDRGESGAEVVSRAHFHVPYQERGEAAHLEGPKIEGTAPFPFT